MVEDVVRNLSQRGVMSFRKTFPELFEQGKIADDEGNIYIHPQGLSGLLSAFVFSQEFDPKRMEGFSGGLFLDLHLAGEHVLLNGTEVAAAKEPGDHFVNLFRGQTPQAIQLYGCLSNRTAALLHYGMEMPQVLMTQMQRQASGQPTG
ncbi:MAG: hypothetical protein HC842_07680, partial [Cytophagales bacterium]|nr:hypothetical protein [Cytophagales bacterium]